MLFKHAPVAAGTQPTNSLRFPVALFLPPACPLPASARLCLRLPPQEERKARALREGGLVTYKQQMSFGVHVLAMMGAFYAFGHLAGMAITSNRAVVSACTWGGASWRLRAGVQPSRAACNVYMPDVPTQPSYPLLTHTARCSRPLLPRSTR